MSDMDKGTVFFHGALCGTTILCGILTGKEGHPYLAVVYAGLSLWLVYLTFVVCPERRGNQ